MRLAEVGRKRLPPAGDEGVSPNWGHVRKVVDHPDELDDVLGDQHLHDQLGIETEATYLVNVKNPRAGGDIGLERDERAAYPEDLQAAFDGNR